VRAYGAKKGGPEKSGTKGEATKEYFFRSPNWVDKQLGKRGSLKKRAGTMGRANKSVSNDARGKVENINEHPGKRSGEPGQGLEQGGKG